MDHQPRTGFLDYASHGISHFSWDNYDRFRPHYPRSFWSRIWDYHAANSNSWETAHDIGTGQGLAAEQLATRFQHVAASDPNAKFLAVAEQRMNRLVDSDNSTTTTFSFGVHRAEDSWLPAGSQDLVSSNCAFHWTDTNVALATTTHSMKPGATLFLATYFRPVVVDNAAVQHAWNDLWDRTFNSGMMTSPKPPIRIRDMIETAFDALELSESHFERGVRRIRINAQDNDAFVSHHLDDVDLQSKSKVGVHDVVEHIQEDGYVPNEASLEWFKGVAVSINPSFREDQFDWTDMKHALDAAGGNVRVRWPIGVVLATRKK